MHHRLFRFWLSDVPLSFRDPWILQIPALNPRPAPIPQIPPISPKNKSGEYGCQHTCKDHKAAIPDPLSRTDNCTSHPTTSGARCIVGTNDWFRVSEWRPSVCAPFQIFCPWRCRWSARVVFTGQAVRSGPGVQSVVQPPKPDLGTSYVVGVWWACHGVRRRGGGPP